MDVIEDDVKACGARPTDERELGGVREDRLRDECAPGGDEFIAAHGSSLTCFIGVLADLRRPTLTFDQIRVHKLRIGSSGLEHVEIEAGLAGSIDPRDEVKDRYSGRRCHPRLRPRFTTSVPFSSSPEMVWPAC